jgi:hypothetical protein
VYERKGCTNFNGSEGGYIGGACSDLVGMVDGCMRGGISGNG